MDVKAYIESGILEEVVLGLGSEQEQQEVACLSKIYPEIAEHRAKLETALENYALTQQVAPPEEMREKILAAIADLPSQEPFTEKEEAKVIPLSREDEQPPFNWLAAASIALLIGVSALYFTQRGTVGDLQSQVAELTDEQRESTDSLNSISNSLKITEGELAVLKDPANQRIVLAGVEKAPDALATIYWNQQNQEVHLVVNNLPEPPSGKQYQLWAIADGVPVDMGVFDVATDSSLQKMVSMPSAQAFAVTLEVEGGSPTPTLEEMVVIGNV